jgi:hypothetical protein
VYKNKKNKQFHTVQKSRGMTIGASVAENFDQRFARGGVNILNPPNSRGPPPCFPQRHQLDDNYLFNRDMVRRVPARTVQADINRYRFTQRQQPPSQAGAYQDMTAGSMNEELVDAFGSNYTRMGVCTEASCGVKGWNGQYNNGNYGDYYAEPEIRRLNALKARRYWAPRIAGYKQDFRTLDTQKFVPREPATQAGLYEAGMVQDALAELGETIKLGPISVDRSWLTWLLLAIVIIFMLDKMMLSSMLMNRSSS